MARIITVVCFHEMGGDEREQLMERIGDLALNHFGAPKDESSSMPYMVLGGELEDPSEADADEWLAALGRYLGADTILLPAVSDE